MSISAPSRGPGSIGPRPLGYTTQAQFLINFGITDLMARTPAQDAAAYLPLAAQAQKLSARRKWASCSRSSRSGADSRFRSQGFRSGDKSRLL